MRAPAARRAAGAPRYHSPAWGSLGAKRRSRAEAVSRRNFRGPVQRLDHDQPVRPELNAARARDRRRAPGCPDERDRPSGAGGGSAERPRRAAGRRCAPASGGCYAHPGRDPDRTSVRKACLTRGKVSKPGQTPWLRSRWQGRLQRSLLRAP